MYKMIQTGATDSSHCQTAHRFINVHTSWADFSEERRIVNSVTEKIKGDSFTALFECRVHTCASKFHQFLDNRFFLFFFSSFLQEACWRHLQHHLICRTSLCILSPCPISRPVLRTVSAMIQNKIKRQEPPLPSQNNDPPLPHSPPMTLSHPFVSAAQNEADSGDASPVDQWAPVVKGCVLSLASLKRQSEIFVQREGEGRVEPVGVGGGGTWHPTRSQPVTGHHIRRRAGMRTF